MKIGGIDPRTLPNEEVLVLPRGDQQIVIRARGIPDMDDFDALCQLPKMPVRFTPNGQEDNPNDAGYSSAMEEYGKRRLAFIVVMSLAPSEVEWDTVKLDVPGTWANWRTDLMNGGLNAIECNRVQNLVFEANALDEAKLKKARDLFLRGPQTA